MLVDVPQTSTDWRRRGENGISAQIQKEDTANRHGRA
jgi:hypothetical protein